MIAANDVERQYKTFTIPDDTFLNEDAQTEVDLVLDSSDRNVTFVEDASSAVLVVVDNESKLISYMYKVYSYWVTEDTFGDNINSAAGILYSDIDCPLLRCSNCIRTIGKSIIWDLENCPL